MNSRIEPSGGRARLPRMLRLASNVRIGAASRPDSRVLVRIPGCSSGFPGAGAGLAWGVRTWPEARAVTGNDHGGDFEYPLAAAGQHRLVRAERVHGRSLGAPPGMRAHAGAVRGGCHRADVLVGMAGGGDQPDRRAQLGAFRVPGDPQVAVVDGP